MIKCNSCGTENDDGQKFCSECGSKLVADEPAAETAAASEVQGAAETERVCPACGSKNEANEKFCSECGKPLDVEPEAKAEDKPKKEHKNKLVGTVVNVKDKTMAFEKKHRLIGNILVAVMALVVILVSLLAPVKYTMYDADKVFGGMMQNPNFAQSSDYDDFEDLEDELNKDVKATRVGYVEVDQSIFNAIGAVLMLTSDYEKAVKEMEKLEEDMAKADEAFEIAYTEIMVEFLAKHPDMEDWTLEEMQKKTEGLQKDVKKAYNKAYKKVNWFAYDSLEYILSFKQMLETGRNASSSGNDASETIDKGKEEMQAMMGLMSSLMTTLITAILRIILAIIALVYLIKAVIRIVKKESSDNALFKLICTTMCMLAPCIALESLSSGLHVGGGAFSLMLTCAIVAIVLGSLNSLIQNIHKPLVVIKNAIIGVLVTVGYFLLCTDFISYKAKTNGVVTQYEYGPLGWALFKGLDAIFDAASSGAGGGSASGVANGALTGMGLTVSGYLISIFFLVTIWLLGIGVARRLRYNACGLITRKNGTTVKDAYGTRALITGIVFGIISILVTLIGSPALIKGMADAIDDVSEGTVQLEATAAFGIRAQVFISVIFTLVAMIFSAVFKPENFGKKNEQKPAAEAAA